MGILDGKAALVTGAQQGIGRAIALALAEAGADVAINYLDDVASATAVAKSVKGFGRRACLVQGDVSLAATGEMLVAGTVGAFGHIDIMVNNAGMFPRHPVLAIAEQDWDFVHGINLRGSFFCAQAAARAMVDAGNGGAIISIASQAITGAVPDGVHYAASKAGIVGMTRAMALELVGHGIRVNAIAPGLVDTAQPRDGHSEDELLAMGAAIPIGRIGQPEEIAAVAVFLASNAASFMVGQTVHPNGGVYMPS